MILIFMKFCTNDLFFHGLVGADKCGHWGVICSGASASIGKTVHAKQFRSSTCPWMLKEYIFNEQDLWNEFAAVLFQGFVIKKVGRSKLVCIWKHFLTFYLHHLASRELQMSNPAYSLEYASSWWFQFWQQILVFLPQKSCYWLVIRIRLSLLNGIHESVLMRWIASFCSKHLHNKRFNCNPGRYQGVIKEVLSCMTCQYLLLHLIGPWMGCPWDRIK